MAALLPELVVRIGFISGTNSAYESKVLKTFIAYVCV